MEAIQTWPQAFVAVVLIVAVAFVAYHFFKFLHGE